MDNEATYHYFKPSGKWAYTRRGVTIAGHHYGRKTHADLRALNQGNLPGIASGGEYYTIVVIDDNDDILPLIIYSEDLK